MASVDARTIVSLLREYAQRTALRGGNPYRAKAYTRAADSLAALAVPLDVLIAEDRLTEIPGVGELMRSEGRNATPLAVLSRSMAGTRGKVLIVTLPGSPKGAVESLDAIVELVPHVLDLLQGQTQHVAARQE